MHNYVIDLSYKRKNDPQIVQQKVSSTFHYLNSGQARRRAINKNTYTNKAEMDHPTQHNISRTKKLATQPLHDRTSTMAIFGFPFFSKILLGPLFYNFTRKLQIAASGPTHFLYSNFRDKWH